MASQPTTHDRQSTTPSPGKEDRLADYAEVHNTPSEHLRSEPLVDQPLHQSLVVGVTVVRLPIRLEQ